MDSNKKKCEVCGEKPASVHLTQMVNNKVKKMHLCESCAAASGLDITGTISIADMLLGLGSSRSEEDFAEKICPHCDISLEEFRKTSRLGCPHCYETFASELDSLLTAMHRSNRHVGKRPLNAPQAKPAYSLFELNKALKKAVEIENYEEAALIRDYIRELKKENSSKSI